MYQKVLKVIVIGCMLILTITGCSLFADEHKGTAEIYDQPVLKLSPDYTVGKFIYKDGKQYYLQENELVEYNPQLHTFLATTKVNNEEKEFSFEWYEWKQEIRLASDNVSDVYFFEPIKGCTSHVLLAIRVPDTEFWTYKLCNLENQTIEPLFDGKLDAYAVDWIEISSNLANATVSINKGEKIVAFDGETMSPIEQMVKENPYKDLYVWNTVLGEKVLVATQDGVLKMLNFASGDVLFEVDTGLDLTYSETGENYNISIVESDKGIYVAIYKSGGEIAIYKL